MGLFSNLFSKKQETPTPVPQAEPEAPKTKGVIKTQRHKLDNIEAHMKDIMELVETINFLKRHLLRMSGMMKKFMNTN